LRLASVDEWNAVNGKGEIDGEKRGKSGKAGQTELAKSATKRS